MVTIERDKQDHATSGALLALLVMMLGLFVGIRNEWILAILGAGTAGWAGILKECRDKRDPEHHTPDPDDALASAIGGIIGAFLGFLLLVLVRPAVLR